MESTHLVEKRSSDTQLSEITDSVNFRDDKLADIDVKDSFDESSCPNNHISRPSSPLHWTTMSDTIVCSPGAVPVLKEFCNNIDSHGPTSDQSLVNPSPLRSKSVSNLDDSKRNHTDEEIRQIRNKWLNIARNRALFLALGKAQKLTLLVISLCYFTSFAAISVLAPFFVNVAVLHNISTTTYSLIFSIHPFMVFCTSPFIGQIIPSIGPKFTFICGVFICGSGNLLFGVLDYIEDDTQFVVLCFVIRGLSAVGASAFSTAGTTFVANLFPDKINAVMVLVIIYYF